MANSSPPTRSRRDPGSHTAANRMSYPWAADFNLNLEELSLEDRNSEESINRDLAQAKRDRESLRKTAIDVLNHYYIQEEQRRVKIEQEQQEARLRAEEKLALERQRLAVLKAKTIPIPPPPKPEPELPKPVTSDKSAPGPPITNGQPGNRHPAGSETHARPDAQKSASLAVPSPATNAQPAASPTPKQTISSLLQPAGPGASPGAPVSQVATPAVILPQPAPAVAPAAIKPDRHVEIHKKLKQLRKFVDEQRKTNPQLKTKMGDMRREIRKSMGQLIEGSLANNRQPVQKILATLREALHGTVSSQPVDPNEFLLEPRNPVEGPGNNSPQLPSLYIYLLNIFAKAAISQFINECGAKPQAADPVGTVVAKIFSDPEFQWRGGSLMDILLAKYRVVCPVLFGFRGNDRTEQGRLRVGWWKDSGGSWVPEQTHVDRMTGLGAGFGAMALRDFSKSKNKNPYPPSKYWEALARIINTPANEVSDTQCYVLKSMIEHYEQKFINFYGNAAVAALRVALVEFPVKLPSKSSAVSALPVLAQILKRDTGLVLQ